MVLMSVCDRMFYEKNNYKDCRLYNLRKLYRRNITFSCFVNGDPQLEIWDNNFIVKTITIHCYLYKLICNT